MWRGKEGKLTRSLRGSQPTKDAHDSRPVFGTVKHAAHRTSMEPDLRQSILPILTDASRLREVPAIDFTLFEPTTRNTSD